MTASYIDFPKQSCPNMSSPCWIPHADSIVKEHIIHALPKCDTIDSYNCMVDTIKKAPYDFVDKRCLRTCSVQSYKIALSRNNIEPVQKVFMTCNNSCALSNSYFLPTEGERVDNLCNGTLPKFHRICVQ